MAKNSYKSFKFDNSIVDAMLVNIVHEHWYSKGTCAGRAPTTIQKSINKLCKLNFISKKI